jgi:hypothetical protein
MSDDGQDKLILPILAQIGCELKDTTSIAAFSGDQLYHAGIHCVCVCDGCVCSFG